MTSALRRFEVALLALASRVALLALAVAGCSVLPHDEPPAPDVALPTDWTAGGTSGPLADGVWWRSYDAPALWAAVEEALLANPDLRASAARVAAAAAQARIAGSERFPSAILVADAQRQKQIFVGLPVPGGADVLESTSTRWGVSFAVSWEADVWGRMAAVTNAAERDALAAAADDRAARESLAAQTAKAWFAWQAGRELVAVAGEAQASFERTLALVRERFGRGRASAFDVKLAEAELAGARAQVTARTETAERALRQLELLLGRYPAGALDAPLGLPPAPPAPPAGAPGELIARRPDLAAAEARVAAADERLHAARADLYPRLTLAGLVGRSGDEPSDLVEPDFSIWSVAGGIVLPLFQGGRLRAAIERQDAELAAALAELESALLGALGEVELALVSERRLVALEDQTRVARDESEAARALAEERFAAGRLDVLELLVADRRALDAASALTEVRRRRLAARADLHLALGGGFEP